MHSSTYHESTNRTDNIALGRLLDQGPEFLCSLYRIERNEPWSIKLSL